MDNQVGSGAVPPIRAAVTGPAARSASPAPDRAASTHDTRAPAQEGGVMRTLLTRLRRATHPPTPPTPHHPPAPPAGRRSPHDGWYRADSCPRLTVAQIRNRHFRTVRRGLRPTDVYAHLHRVASELATTRHALTTATEENTRIKTALRTWQSQFTPGGNR
ncbi:DivIVA domain-containing protein [Micromonospora yangpuensis]